MSANRSGFVIGHRKRRPVDSREPLSAMLRRVRGGSSGERHGTLPPLIF